MGVGAEYPAASTAASTFGERPSSANVVNGGAALWFGNDFHPSCHCSRVIGRRNEGRIRRLQRNMRFLAASRTSTACKSQLKYHRKISNCFNCAATIEINAELEQIYSNYQKLKSICVAEFARHLYAETNA
ncbi:hypothetical protein HED50_07130 [Ochrobactrum oryzae]|nr:hypothetical protein [Brucella oryzae]